MKDPEQKASLRSLAEQQEQKDNEQDVLKDKARESKVVPVIVTLNADKLNSAEMGAGFVDIRVFVYVGNIAVQL